MPHVEHVIVLAIVEAMVVIDVRTMSSRSGNVRRVTMAGVGAGAHVIRDMDPDEPANMSTLLAFE